MVWAPRHERLSVKLTSQRDRIFDLAAAGFGYFLGDVADVVPGDRYLLQFADGSARPDPASHFQPDGVHQPSAVVDHAAFEWSDEDWDGMPLGDMIQYELHVGTFTPRGTFDAAIDKLAYLKDLGVNAIELLPVAQFPGNRNWGYDGAYPYAVQNSYGGPDGLKRLVNACHAEKLAVVLDVVYNHLGPEGNYLGEFAPYFTERYSTPWGPAVNFDGSFSYGVRHYFLQNALHWFDNYHIDALRLDAIHGVFDFGAKHILQELVEKTGEFSKAHHRRHTLIAESDLNDTRVIKPWESGGYGIDGQWSDDFHHAVHAMLTGERKGYYADFGRRDQVKKAVDEGFVYDWEYSFHRKRYHGSSSADIPTDRFVIFTQNHDQVGNRMHGDRLVNVTSVDAARLAAGLMMLSPNVPMLFMGEEYAERNPFLYFVSHGDPVLVEAVRRGRRREFKTFGWVQDPPDPQSERTFESSKLNWHLLKDERHAAMHGFYRELIKLRRTTPALSRLSRSATSVTLVDDDRVLVVAICIFNLTNETLEVDAEYADGGRLMLSSQAGRWGGSGSPVPEHLSAGTRLPLDAYAFVVYLRA
ncbi:MAG: malto-oligosyltrehalose trehalohydrolase [bacterium]